MTDLRHMAEELLTLGAVRDAILTEYKRRHAALLAEYHKLGLERQRVYTNDGTEFGVVVMADGAVTVEVTDRDAMEDWLLHDHPSEAIERTVYDVNPAFWRRVEEESRRAGHGIDPTNGAYLPWIRVRVGDKTMRATPTREAKRAVRELIRDAGVRFELEAE